MFPKLCDGGGKVGGVGGNPNCFVLAVGVLNALISVPGLIALGPGQLWLETLEQVVETPGEDDDVVDIQEGYNHNGGVANTSKDGAKLLPAGDATLRSELTKSNLQEEDWQTSAKQENEVGDEKRTSTIFIAEVRETPNIP